MIRRTGQALTSPAGVAMLVVGATLGGLLVGYEPIGGDPDRLYRPIKMELARSLHAGTLPFWSDRFGLGVPLVAESHAAAFYPPNWLLYGFLDVSAAYRLSMWLHYLALAAATFAYARRLQVQPWGAALAGVAFSLCGFQAIHSSHEPFYSALPFLPLVLCFVEDYIARRRALSLAMIALLWGVQITLGHFQIAAWTAALAIVTGLWRRSATGDRAGTTAALLGALAWGASIASVQLVLSWDLAHFTGAARRSIDELMFYVYPPAHWAELAIPRLFQAVTGGPEGAYWSTQATTAYEARFYIGTVALIFAFVGFTARGDVALKPWRAIVPASIALATMPAWWPAGYELLLQLPGVGYFRAPARYTLLTALGLSLFAGRGFDRAVSASRVAVGLVLALLFCILASAWAIYWTQLPQHRAAFAGLDVAHLLMWNGAAWALGVGAIIAWRYRVIGPLAPLLLAALELGILFHQGTTVWDWSTDIGQQSPVLRRLAQELDGGTVAGEVHDLPVHVGRAATYPYLGMRMPPPTSAMEFARFGTSLTDSRTSRLLWRLGASHAIWPAPLDASGAEVLYAGPDEVLDERARKRDGTSGPATWYLVRLPTAPGVHVATRARDVPDVRTVLAYLAQDASTDTAWFLPGDRPPDQPEPRARSARIVWWEGLSGEVEHDGACDLVVRRTYAPGWTARVDDGPETPVSRVDGGLQGIRLNGSGRSRVVLTYRPPGLAPALAATVLALGLVLFVLGRATVANHRGLNAASSSFPTAESRAGSPSAISDRTPSADGR
jgi:hypothetical protein